MDRVLPTTRVKVESMAHTNPSRSLMRWLDNVADLLEREGSVRKRGAPRAISQAFVAGIATIWRTLGPNPGLAYDFFLHPANDHRIRRGGRVLAFNDDRICEIPFKCSPIQLVFVMDETSAQNLV